METSENKKSFFQNDRLLVGSMLAFYGLCILGCVAAVFWGLNRTNQTLSASATSTAIFQSAQQANATATAIVHATELAQYEIVDRFDSNINRWQTGPQLGLGWNGSHNLKSGIFIWDLYDVYQDYAVISMDFLPGNDYIENYNTYIDTKFAEAPSGTACSGLMFRKSPLGWDTGGYSFMLCDLGYFNIYYHNAKGGWQEIHSQYHPAIQSSDWNRLEILVEDSHFVFIINSQVVYEADDERQPVGGVALMVEVEESGTKILFDNFGYQTR